MNPLTVETPLWAYLAAAGFVIAVSWAAGWLKDRYELAGSRPVRRWYSSGARVTGTGGASRYRVASWSDEATRSPWLLALPADDEDADPFWAPVTAFTPGWPS